MFSTAYVKVYKSAEGNTLETQTIPCILVGNDTKSDGRLFYNPETKQPLGSSDYRLDTSHPSGPMFNLTYNGGLNFHLFDPTDVSDSPPAFHLNQTIYLHPSHPNHPSAQATILTIPTSSSEPYMIQLSESKDIIAINASEILPHNPTRPYHNVNPVLTLPWIQHQAKATLFLPDSMTTPKQGFLLKTNDDWSFLPGHSLNAHSKRNNPQNLIPLPNFTSTAESLYYSKQLIQGWKQFQHFIQD